MIPFVVDLCVHFKTRFLFGPAFCRTNIYKGIKLVLELFRGLFFAHIVATTLKRNSVCVKSLKIAIYLTSIIKPSFYYPCVAVGKILAVADFLAGRDCQILQIETQKRNAFTLSFLSRRDLQILLVEPAKNPKTAKFWRPTHMGNNRRILLTRTIQSFM